jgi:iron(III) transport system substrate-binding protein
VNDLRQNKLKLILVLGVALMVLVWQALSREQLVVYCAHDAVFAQAVLRDFQKQTGIEVVAKFDTEATKSLGLVEQIIRDGARPRCDVFWNNELLGTQALAERGLLESYKGAGWQRMPERWRGDGGEWAGFGGRLRMVIWNTNARFANPRPWRFPVLATEQVPVTDERGGPTGKTVLPDLLLPSADDDLSRLAIAKPIFGTTLTHYAVLWDFMGAERLKRWHRESRSRGLREVSGNAATRDLVAAGTCDAGWTDTDDFFTAKNAGASVEAMPFETARGPICIPNTVAIIRGTSRMDHARRFADYLLSARTEVALAHSMSRQIPLGPLDEKDAAQLPAEVRELLPHAARAVPLKGLLRARTECLEWLKSQM